MHTHTVRAVCAHTCVSVCVCVCVCACARCRDGSRRVNTPDNQTRFLKITHPRYKSLCPRDVNDLGKHTRFPKTTHPRYKSLCPPDVCDPGKQTRFLKNTHPRCKSLCPCDRLQRLHDDSAAESRLLDSVPRKIGFGARTPRRSRDDSATTPRRLRESAY